MRELNCREVEQVSGGITFAGSVETGSTLGAASYGGLVLAGGYELATITASFAAGGAIGGIAGACFFAGYEIGVGAGMLGSAIGTELAIATN